MEEYVFIDLMILCVVVLMDILENFVNMMLIFVKLIFVYKGGFV